MEEQKKPPLINVILWTLFGSAIGSAIFGGIIAATSKYSFLGVTSFIYIALMAICIPMFIWMGAIEPLWWDKLSNDAQEKIRNWGAGLFVVFFIFLIPAGILGGNDWSGEGQVNLFPDGAVSKNYRLASEMEVKNGFLWRKTYVIDSVQWPDGGSSSFSDCTIGNSNQTCTDDEGRNWRIEVVERPEAPDTSND